MDTSGPSIPRRVLQGAWSALDNLWSLQLMAEGGFEGAPAPRFSSSGCLSKKTKAYTFQILRSSSQSSAEYLLTSSFPAGTGDLELGD